MPPNGEAPVSNDGVGAQAPVVGGADEKTSPLGGGTTSDQPTPSGEQPQPTLSPDETAPTPGGENTVPNEPMEKEPLPKPGESGGIVGESELLGVTTPGGDEVATPNAGADATTHGEEATAMAEDKKPESDSAPIEPVPMDSESTLATSEGEKVSTPATSEVMAEEKKPEENAAPIEPIPSCESGTPSTEVLPTPASEEPTPESGMFDETTPDGTVSEGSTPGE